jgi:hypothetical protein
VGGGRAGVRPEGQWLKVPVYTRATGVPINHWVMGMGEGGMGVLAIYRRLFFIYSTLYVGAGGGGIAT